MKQKVLFSLLILMLMSISVSAQTGGGRIAGVVIDNTDEDPLPGATLFIEELKKGDVTNKYGEFSFSDIPFGTYTFTVKFMGYQTAVQKVTVSKENVKKTIIRLKAEVKSLDEVVVMGKSEARKIREQAMPVTVYSMSQLQGTINSVEDILTKTVGVTIRSQGAVGSASRISVRGLEGKRIGFFIDEVPMNDNSDFIDINDIPIDMIDRIEIYKGVVIQENEEWIILHQSQRDFNFDGYLFINKNFIKQKNIVSTDRISAKILSLNYSPMWKYEGKGIDCTNTMHIFSTFMEKKENIAIGLESDDYILVGKIAKLNRKSIVLNKIDEQTNFIQSQRIPFSKIRLIEYKNNYLTSLSKYENLFASID